MPRKDAEKNLKRKTIRKWEEILLSVSKGGSPWSVNRLAIDDDRAEKLKMNFVLYIQVLFAQNGIANWRESNCQQTNYLRTFISRVLKVNLVLFSFPPFGRRVLPKLFNFFWQTLSFVASSLERLDRKLVVSVCDCQEFAVFTAQVNGNAIRFGNSGGLNRVIAFHSQWRSIRNGRTCCLLYTWMLFKRAAVGVTTSIITSAQKTATTRWRVNGDGPFQVSGNFSFLTGTWVSGHAEYFVRQTTLYVIEFICLIGVVICKRQGKMAVDSSEKSP